MGVSCDVQFVHPRHSCAVRESGIAVDHAIWTRFDVSEGNNGGISQDKSNFRPWLSLTVPAMHATEETADPILVNSLLPVFVTLA